MSQIEKDYNIFFLHFESKTVEVKNIDTHDNLFLFEYLNDCKIRNELQYYKNNSYVNIIFSSQEEYNKIIDIITKLKQVEAIVYKNK